MIFTCPSGCSHDFGWKNPPRTCDLHGAPWSYSKPLKSREVGSSAGKPEEAEMSSAPSQGETRQSRPSAASSTPKHKGLKRSQRRESAAERTARFHFNEMCRTRACFLSWQERPGHRCEGQRDAHHLVPKSVLRQRLSYLPEKDLLAIIFNPLLGAPLCRRGHEEIEARTEFIYWDELEPELIEYVGSLPDFVLMRLELECPKHRHLDLDGAGAV